MNAIFFDLYETLVTHFDPDWQPPLQSIAQRLGVEDRAFSDHWSRFDTAWQLGEISTYEAALAAFCAHCGSTPDSAVLARLAREYQDMTARVFSSIEPEIVKMVTTLKNSGFKLGIITNASDLDAAPWSGCSLAPYFDDFLASHDVGLLKRDEQFFELACQRLNVQPGQAIFVGDGGGNELQSAARAGLAPYWCTWFLDRWPEGIRPNGFPGDDWRQHDTGDPPPFERLQQPADLLAAVLWATGR